MNAGFDRIVLGSFVGIGELLSRSGRAAGVWPGRSLLWLPVTLLVGCGIWLLMPPSEGNVAQGEPAKLVSTAVESAPSGAAPTAVTAAAPSETQTLGAAELDRLRISSQTWRRGGLGSKALVTFTLRNDNDYGVRDVEIACAFTRRDGSHLTDRSRVLAETVNMKSRKTFARVHVGFVNINASQARCSLVAARRA